MPLYLPLKKGRKYKLFPECLMTKTGSKHRYMLEITSTLTIILKTSRKLLKLLMNFLQSKKIKPLFMGRSWIKSQILPQKNKVKNNSKRSRNQLQGKSPFQKKNKSRKHHKIRQDNRDPQNNRSDSPKKQASKNFSHNPSKLQKSNSLLPETHPQTKQQSHQESIPSFQIL